MGHLHKRAVQSPVVSVRLRPTADGLEPCRRNAKIAAEKDINDAYISILTASHRWRSLTASQALTCCSMLAAVWFCSVFSALNARIVTSPDAASAML